MAAMSVAKSMLMCLVAAGTAQATASEPVDYWFTANNGSETVNSLNEPGVFRLESSGPSVPVDWEDGNILNIRQRGFLPESLRTAAPEGIDLSNTTIGGGVFRPYKIVYRSGERSLNSAVGGRIELGAGGYTSTGSWDTHFFSIKGGLHLAASQEWNIANNVDFNTVVTVADGISWAVNGGDRRYGILKFRNENDLSGCDIVAENYVRFYLTKPEAAMNAKSLTLKGTVPYVIFDATKHELVFGRDYAASLVLRAGASLAATNAFEGGAFDFDSITVASGTSTIGSQASYSIKDGGVQPLVVAEGATVELLRYPTSGRFKVSGAGTLKTPGNGWPDVDFDGFTGKVSVRRVSLDYDAMPAGFNGTLLVEDGAVRVKNLAGFTGSFEFSGSSSAALPPMSEWPQGVLVKTADDAVVYLPSGSEIDTTRLSGTANVQAVARGWTTEPAGTLRVGAGETLVIAGDGFSPATTLEIAGGRVWFPCDAAVGSPVTVASVSGSRVGAAYYATGVFSGAASFAGKLSVSNAVSNCSLIDGVYQQPAGRIRFSGGGESSGAISVTYGELEFSGNGKRWTLAAGVSLDASGSASRLIFDDGVKFELLDAEPGVLNGVNFGGTAATCPLTVVIGNGAELIVGNNRRVLIGGAQYQSHSTVIVDGGTFRLKSPRGGFCSYGYALSSLKNTGDDRCAMAEIKVINGGILETDRVLSSPPVTHKLDASSIYGSPFKSGLHLLLDGGTYATGPGFGRDTDYSSAHYTANVLFGMTSANMTDTSGESWFESVDRTYEYRAEISIVIGPGGGTFDISGAKASCLAVTNTASRLIETAGHASFYGKECPFEGGYVPSRGVQWTLNGPLTFKGREDQTLVMDALDDVGPSAVKVVGVHGVSASTNAFGEISARSLETVEIAGGSGRFSVADKTGAEVPLDVGSCTVAGDGWLDTAAFFPGSKIGTLSFSDGATLVKSTDAASPLTVDRAVLASEMSYFTLFPRTLRPALEAREVEVPDVGTVWTRAEGSRLRSVTVSDADVRFDPAGMRMIVQ